MSGPSLLRDAVLGVLLPVGLVAGGVLAFVFLGKAEPEQKGLQGSDLASRMKALPEAEVERVESFDVEKQSLDIDVQGNVVPFRELSIGAEVTGRIVYKDPNCRQGRYITKGQILFRVDPQDYELEVQRLAKMLEQDYASLRELEQELVNIQKSLDVINEELVLHDAELTRLQQLPDGFVSDTELDNARRARLVSVNQQVAFQNQLDLTQKRRVRLEAAEKLAETQLRKAQLDLSRCEIKSPVDGVIVSDLVESDSFVQRGSTLATVEDTSNVEVSCSLRMDQLYWVLDQKGATEGGNGVDESAVMAGRYALPATPVTVEFQVAGREQRTYAWEGVLSRYEGSGIDPQSRTVPCRVRVDKPYEYKIDGKLQVDDRVSGPPALVRGMFVELKVHTKPRTPLLLVPKMAVKPGNVVWLFQQTEEVLKSVDANKQPADTGSAAAATDSKISSETKIATEPATDFKPQEWSAGRMLVIDNLQVVRPFAIKSEEPGIEDKTYWVCEKIGEEFKAGDWVVVTPMASVKGDGSDAVRVYSKSFGGSVPAAESSPNTPAAISPGVNTVGNPVPSDAS